MPVDQLEKEKGGELAWNEAEPALRGATALLKENQGPFFLGETVSYADLVWATVLLFSKRMGMGFFEEALKRSGDAQVHLDLLEAVRPWSERDGY
jgi:glutathione S-transferase